MIPHHSTGIWKGPDSPAGHEFHAPRSFASLPDCPVCRYGTPVPQGKDDHGKEKPWKCIDCGARINPESIHT